MPPVRVPVVEASHQHAGALITRWAARQGREGSGGHAGISLIHGKLRRPPPQPSLPRAALLADMCHIFWASYMHSIYYFIRLRLYYVGCPEYDQYFPWRQSAESTCPSEGDRAAGGGRCGPRVTPTSQNNKITSLPDHRAPDADVTEPHFKGGGSLVTSQGRTQVGSSDHCGPHRPGATTPAR